VKALGWLRANTQNRSGKLRTLLRAMTAGRISDVEAAARMDLGKPTGVDAWIESRLLSLALSVTKH